MSHASFSTNWLTYGHDYTNERFSPLAEINTKNVFRLVPAYVFQTGVLGPFETTPIVSDNAMYITTANDGVFAIDAVNGSMLWKRPPLKGRFRECCGPVNRGVGLTSDFVIMGQLDGVLVALDRQTGKLRWTSVVADNTAGYSITMAPLVYRKSVLVGVSGSDLGIRGSLTAYSLSNGKQQWKWYATDPQHWFGLSARLISDSGLLDGRSSAKLKKRFANSWRRGGGGIWSTPAIDPDRNAVYLTTGNPWPDADGATRPGDNLFTDCIVSLDASTGRMKWYFQEVAHDVEDLDAASPPFLFETVDKNGRKVAAVGEVGKTGLFYVLNRDTGKLIRRSSTLALLDSAAEFQSWEGGSAWSPASFDPDLGHAILSTTQHLRPEPGGRGSATGRWVKAWNSGYGAVSAVDVATGQVRWQDKFDEGLVGGSVSTAGGLTFVGEGNGYFDALDTESGKLLWHFQTGAGVNAAPIVFEASNREYIAVASGGNEQFGTPYGDAVFVFGLAKP